MLETHFSDLLGKIFYAAAFADKVIRHEEIEVVPEVINSYWEDERILKEFYECVNLNYDAKKVLDEVLAHKIQYPELFTDESNKRIVDTAYAIVNAASGTNKSEIVFISQLTNALKLKK